MLPLPLVIFTEPLDIFPPQSKHPERAASVAFGEMARRSVPLVFVSRGTRTELEFIRRKLGNQHPFITENGGGLFVPEGYFRTRPEGAETIRHYHRISFARPYSESCAALDDAAEAAGVEVVGFHNMSAREVAENSGLPPQLAEAARLREYNEPFFFVGEEAAASKKLAEAAKQEDWNVERGPRFWHFSSGASVAAAVRRLMEMYRAARHAKVRSLAIGSNHFDLPMMAAAGRALLLSQTGGNFDDEVLGRLPSARRADGGGLEGWNAAVLAALGADL